MIVSNTFNLSKLGFNNIGDIPVSTLKTDYIITENVNQYKFDIQTIHPSDIYKYLPYWRRIKKLIVEGMWGKEWGGYRYASGPLIFYANFFTIQDTDENKQTRYIKPEIWDLVWEMTYLMLEAEGFSGFHDDDKYTSDSLVLKYDQNKSPETYRERQLFRSDGHLKEYISPRKNMKMIHDKPKGVPLFYNEAKNISVLGSRGGGKATPLYTKIFTPNGETTMGDIKVGSYVFNRYGKPTKVTHIHPQGQKEIYEVHLRDGRVVECCKDHLWTVRHQSGIEKTLSVEDMFLSGIKYDTKRGGVWKYRVPVCEAVEYSKSNLPIDPYVLGILIADGILTTGTPKVATSDKCVLRELNNRLENFEIKYDSHTNNNYTLVDRDKEVIHIDTSDSDRFKIDGYYAKTGNRLVQALKKLGLRKSCKEKFIPDMYMNASIDQRMELLRGLMDSDGYCSTNGSCEYTTTNEELAKQVLLLVRSLGIVCSLGVDDRSHIVHEIKGHTCNKPKAFRIYINTTKEIFKSKQKLRRLANKKETNQQKYIPIVNIVKTGRTTEMQCITVECDSHTYLTDDYVVTHNSYVIAGRLLHAIVTDGGKYYSEKTGKFYKIPVYTDEYAMVGKNAPTVEVMVGSGDTDKSSEFISKIQQAMNALATEKEFGVWGTTEDPDHTPCPLYKDMSGSSEPGNKKKPWIHLYKLIQGGRDVYKGTESKLYHVSYSEQKAKGRGSQAGAGGRVLYSVVEESGLCFGKDTEVRMYDGSVKKIQDIQNGDLVMGEDGTKRTVVGVTSGVDKLYKVKQTFGDDYVVNSVHPICVKQKLWGTKRSSYKIKIVKKEIPAKEFNATPNLKSHYGYKNKLIIFSKKELKLDPYYLGLWLGDGSSGSQCITSVDKEIIRYLEDLSIEHSCVLRDKSSKNRTSTFCPTITKGRYNPVRQGLQYYGLINNKHIPIDFIHTSEEDRLQLLAGLLDSDGSLCGKGTVQQGYEFSQVERKELVEQVQYLCQTLGLKATLTSRVRNTGYNNKHLEDRIQYRLYISGDLYKIPCKVERKKAEKIQHKKDYLNTSLKVLPLQEGEYYGFTLKESPYFILKDGTVVHNTSNSIEIHNSNTNVVSRSGVQFGVQADIGTSGNLDAIAQTKKKFMNPQDYNIVEFPDEWENLGKDGKLGFFLPFYMTLKQFKDSNGNTDFYKAFEYINELRRKAAKSSDPSVLREEKMNRPIVPSEMWISDKGYYLPYEESVAREKELVKDNLYERIGTKVKLRWDSNAYRGVGYRINTEAEPFYEWPVNTHRMNLDGSVVIYDFPKHDAPNDFYFFTHDPYVSENIDEGGSLGVTHGWISPKYWDEYMPRTGPLVCTYIAKPLDGLKGYYSTQEKLIQMYGNPPQGLAFEANYGADCKNYYQMQNKTNILMPRPTSTEDTKAFARRVTEYGIRIGNRISKINFLDKAKFWLLSPVHVAEKEKKVIETIPCIFTIRQIMSYDIDGNFDAVSSMILAPKFIEDLEFKMMNEVKDTRHNPLAFFSQNPRMFKDPDPLESWKRRYETNNKIKV